MDPAGSVALSNPWGPVPLGPVGFYRLVVLDAVVEAPACGVRDDLRLLLVWEQQAAGSPAHRWDSSRRAGARIHATGQLAWSPALASKVQTHQESR